MTALQLEGHVRWSEDKHGVILIHSRYSRNATSYIRSVSGKTIWRGLVEGEPTGGGVTEKSILHRLYRQFGGSVSMAILKRDLTEFLDQLVNQRIIRVVSVERNSD